MNYLTIQDYESTPMTSSKSYKLKIINKQGKNRLNFDLQQVSNLSRRSASFRKKTSSRLFRDAKIIPIENKKSDKSQSPKLTTPTMKSTKGKKVSFNLRDVQSSDKIPLYPRKKSSSKISKKSLKSQKPITAISVSAPKSEKQSNSQNDFENQQKEQFLPESGEYSQNKQNVDHDHINFVRRMQSSMSNGVELRKKKSKTQVTNIAQRKNELMESLSLLIMQNGNKGLNRVGKGMSEIDFEQSILQTNEDSRHSLQLSMEPQTLIISKQLRDLSYLIRQN